MSRARVVCSKILNCLPTVNPFEQLTVVSDQDLNGKLNIYNLNENQSISAGNILSVTFCPNMINGESHQECEVEENECRTMVDSWLNKSDIAMEESCEGFLRGTGLALEQTNKKEDRAEIDSGTLVLNNSVDPLLNVPGEVSVSGLTFASGDTAKDLTASDCDSSIYKTKMWDTLSIASRKSDSDKNSDFIDFNLLPYAFDANDLIESVTEKSIGTSITYELEPDTPFDNILIQDTNKIAFESAKYKISSSAKHSKPRTVKLKRESDGDPMLTIPSRIDKNMNVDEMYANVLNENDETQDTAMFEISTTDLLSKENPNDSDFNLSSEDLTSVIEPILKEPVNNFEDLAKEEERVMKQHRISEIANMVGLIAVVSNSTVNKAKPRTKMLIKTEKGDERYEGNTADLMLPLSSRKKDSHPPAPAIGKHIITSVETAATIKESPNTPCYRHEPEDDIVRDMLNVLGITNDMLFTILTNLNFRVWICPEHECRKIYNRLHTLKTHILSHYGLKPFKVSLNL